MIVHEKVKPDQIYTLTDKAYYVDQIRYKIDIWVLSQGGLTVFFPNTHIIVEIQIGPVFLCVEWICRFLPIISILVMSYLPWADRFEL